MVRKDFRGFCCFWMRPQSPEAAAVYVVVPAAGVLPLFTGAAGGAPGSADARVEVEL